MPPLVCRKSGRTFGSTPYSVIHRRWIGADKSSSISFAGRHRLMRSCSPPRHTHADSHRSRFQYPDGNGEEIATVLYALGRRAFWTASICAPPGSSRLGGGAKLGREDSAVGLRSH